MSTTIDSKVVEMKFDNKNFESNAATSISTLGRLKQALNLSGASKGLDDVASSAGRVNGPMSGVASAVETVRSKFSALEVIGVTALANITNSAVNAGKNLVKSLSIDQITAGWQKFSDKTTSVATLVSQGNELETVNEQLDRLNWFTDETSYNFTDMVSNIAKFTATGKGLEESVTAMEGIANWAALSGQNASTASRAMYQISQAMGAGVMRLEDYKSIQNASMDTDEFRQKCLETAVALGTLKEQSDGTYKSLVGGDAFNKSQFTTQLTEGAWLTSDVMMQVFSDYSKAVDAIYEVTEEKGMLASEVLDQIHDRADELKTDDMTETDAINAAIKDLGYTLEDGSLMFDAFGVKAFEAAQKARTWGDAVDSVKDAVSTGWMNTFEIIFGNAEEATELWTDLANAMYDVFAGGAEARNEMLKEWKELGGRDALIESFWNAWEGVASIISPIKEAFREIFPAMTAKRLYDITQNLKKFTEGLKLSGETGDKVKRIFKGLFSIIDIVRKVITTAVKALFGLSQSDGIGSLADFVLDTAAAIGDFFTSLNQNFDTNGLAGIFSTISSKISGLLQSVTNGLSGLGDALSKVGQWIVKVAQKIWGPIKKVFTWIKDNVSIGDVFAGLAGGGIFVTAKKLSGLFDTIKGAIDKLLGKNGGGLKDLKDKFCDVLDSVRDSLKAFTSGIKVWSLVGIAVAVGILAHSLRTLSELKAVDIGKSLIGIGIALSILVQGFKSMTKSLSKFESKGIVKSAFALILVSAAVTILASAMKKIGELPLKTIGKGLIGIAGGIGVLCGGLKLIGKTKVSLSTSVAMLALAASCSILGDALKKFGQMSWSEIGRGLSAMGGALGELVVALAVLSKTGGWRTLLGSVGILIAVQGLGKLADALKKFGQMAWDEIGRGLSAMGGALGEVGIVLAAVGKIAGFSSIFAAEAIWITIQGLDDLADALMTFGYMSWSEIGRGLSAMGGALGEVGLVTGALGKIAGFSGIFGSSAILLTIQGLDELANALMKFGEMSWSEIGRGLSAMGGALLEVGGITGALGYLTNFAGILGAGSIWIAIQGLDDLANAFKKFGEMSWSEIGRGLSAMGGALLEVGGITGALGYLTNFAGLLGSASIWVAVQGLGDLADAFKKFGEMSWSEIGRGLSAMGGALGELALGGLLNTLSIIGSYSISEVAEPLGILADSVKKWEDVTVPKGLGLQLSSLASGICSFTFDGLGASAIATVAEPLGVLADSVKKWAGVVVPEGLGEQLDALAGGVSAFTFSGLGASAIAEIGTPLGALADSVKKWAGVTVPEGLEENLTALANGIKAFTWAFAGGWSINTIIEPLAALPDSVKKWNGVAVPAGLKDGLTDLADGVKAFSFAFVGGWSINAIITPLGDLAGTVKKWTGITAPEGLKDSLKAIADGISEFGLLDVAKIQAIDDNLLTLSTALKNFSSVQVSGDILITFAKNLKSCSTELSGLDSSSITTASSTINTLVNSIKKVNSTNVSNVGAFVSAANSLNNIDISEIKVDTGNLSSAIKTIKDVMSSMSKTISSSKESISTAMGTAMSGVTTAIDSKKEGIVSAAKKITEAITNAVNSKKNTITNAFKTLVSGAASGIRTQYSLFYSAGSYLVTGFSKGISENSYKAAAKAKAMAEAAVKAAKEELAINSPSKVFRAIGAGVPEGFAQGISRSDTLVIGATRSMADTAVNSTKQALAKIADIVTSDVETQPTIRPVVDLSNVKAGAAAVSGMFAATPSVGLLSNVGSINAIMNRRNQNGVNDDVVSAIKDLKKTLGEATGDTYTIGNVSYGDDSAVSDAVHSLVRAIRLEGRT